MRIADALARWAPRLSHRVELAAALLAAAVS
jgi:hypothetical protein